MTERIFAEINRNRTHYLRVILFSLLTFMAFENYYMPANRKRAEVVKEEKKLKEEILKLKKKLTRLENKCEALKSNEPETVEKVIREEFGWGKKDEVLITTP